MYILWACAKTFPRSLWESQLRDGRLHSARRTASWLRVQPQKKNLLSAQMHLRNAVVIFFFLQKWGVLLTITSSWSAVVAAQQQQFDKWWKRNEMSLLVWLTVFVTSKNVALLLNQLHRLQRHLLKVRNRGKRCYFSFPDIVAGPLPCRSQCEIKSCEQLLRPVRLFWKVPDSERWHQRTATRIHVDLHRSKVAERRWFDTHGIKNKQPHTLREDMWQYIPWHESWAALPARRWRRPRLFPKLCATV